MDPLDHLDAGNAAVVLDAYDPFPDDDAPDRPRRKPAPRADLPVLVVDLDGTLIRSDMLLETFWAALSRSWHNVFAALSGLWEGRAALKRRLSTLGQVDVTTLPYNDAIMDSVMAWRAKGGRTALVSATDDSLVQAIAAHLGIFDEAHGSDGVRNLKGAAKAAFLRDRFAQGYVYAGDSAADLPVWHHAKGAITVDLPGRLRDRVRVAEGEITHISTDGNGDGSLSRRGALLKALRPHQWLKNLLVFLPMLAAHQFDLLTLGQSVLVFVVFSLTASSVYLTNDLLDLSADRHHPRKRKRPFAAGAASLWAGTFLAPGLLVAAFALATLLGPLVVAVMALYYALTTLYSFALKRMMVVDICTLAILYTLRIIAGGAATGLPLSVWLLAFSIFFFFALAAMKRQAELVSSEATGTEQTPGRGYMASDLPFVSMMALAAGYVSILVLALYLNSSAVAVLYSNVAALWGICVVLLYWISRACMLTHRGQMHDDPVLFAARDRTSLFCVAIIAVLAVAGSLT